MNTQDTNALAQDENGKVYTTATEASEVLAEEIANAPDSIESASGKVKKQRAKKVVAEKPVKEEPRPFVMYVADPEVTSVALSDIVPLDSVPVENGLLAMREISKSHVSGILEGIKAGDIIPPIEVVNTNYGIVPFDGLHRTAAYEQYLREILSEGLDEGQELDNAMLLEARKQFFIPSHENTVNSPRELLQLAFSANLKHGLPASETSRSRFALWLYKERMAEWEAGGMQGKKPSIRKAAIDARVSHVAVLKVQARIQASQKKMIDVLLSEEDQSELEDITGGNEVVTDEQKELDKASKHMEALLKAVQYFSTSDITSTEMHSFVESYAKKVTKEDVIILQNETRSLLSYLYDAAPNGATPEQQELLKA